MIIAVNVWPIFEVKSLF